MIKWTILWFLVVVVSCTNIRPDTSENDRFMETLIEFIRKEKWKRVLIITDSNKDVVRSSKILSTWNVYSTFEIINGSICDWLDSFVEKKGNRRTKEKKILYETLEWIFIKKNVENSRPDWPFLKNLIRVNGEAFASILSKRLIKTMEYKKSSLVDTVSACNRRGVSDSNLCGINLTVSTFDLPPTHVVREINGVVRVEGFRHDLLLLSARYLNFRIQYLPLHKEGEVLKSNSYAKQIKLLRRKKIDVGGMVMPMVSNEVDVISFSSFLFTDTTVIVYRNVKYDSCGKDFRLVHLNPFTNRVWQLILTVSCLCISAFSVASLVHSGVNRSWYRRINSVLYVTLIFYPSQGYNLYRCPPPSKKIMCVVFIFFAYLIYSCYECVITAVLTADKHGTTFKTITDMVDDGRFIFAAFKNTPIDIYVKGSTSGVFNLIKNLNMYESIEFKSYDSVSADQRVLSENFALISTSRHHLNKNCSFSLLKTNLLPWEYAFSFAKNSPYVEPFSKFILRLRSFGILGKTVSASSSRRCEFSKKLEAITLSRCKLPFLALSVGVAFAVMSLFLELIMVKCEFFIQV